MLIHSKKKKKYVSTLSFIKLFDLVKNNSEQMEFDLIVQLSFLSYTIIILYTYSILILLILFYVVVRL